MKSLLLAATLAFTASAASAVEMPDFLHGEWCTTDSAFFMQMKPCDAGSFVIHSHGVSGDEDGCLLLSIKSERTAPRSDQWLLSMRCTGEDGGLIKFRYHLDKGIRLFITRVR